MQALSYAAENEPMTADPQVTEERLGRAILALPERQRVLLCLHYFEGLKLDEVASLLDATEEALSGEYLSALESLERLLAPGAGLAAA